MVHSLTSPRNFREIANYFLVFVLFGLGFVVAAMLFQFALPRPKLSYIGLVAEFSAEPLPVRQFVPTSAGHIPVWVVNTGEELKVFNARTPGYVCYLDWVSETSSSRAPGYFIDPCTGSSFYMDGTYRYGPAPRNLDWWPTEIRDGALWVDVLDPQKGESWNK